MKYLLASFLFALISCSPSVDGLWIEKNNQGILKFYGDSVINNSQIMRGRLGYRITKDSLTWTGLNADWNDGKTENSFKYKLDEDSLHIWFGRQGYVTTYFKVRAETYHDYLLKRDDITLNLPRADHARPLSGRVETLDIKIGFRHEEIIIYIQDSETDKSEIAKAIGRFVEKADTTAEFACRLFVDENVPCAYTLGLFDFLRLYNIRRIYFITKTKDADEFVDDFTGLSILLPHQKVEFVEEKNQN